MVASTCPVGLKLSSRKQIVLETGKRSGEFLGILSSPEHMKSSNLSFFMPRNLSWSQTSSFDKKNEKKNVKIGFTSKFSFLFHHFPVE